MCSYALQLFLLLTFAQNFFSSIRMSFTLHPDHQWSVFLNPTALRLHFVR